LINACSDGWLDGRDDGHVVEVMTAGLLASSGVFDVVDR